MTDVSSITEDDLKCGICFELLVNPTTLTCGHTICRYCLAQWWYKSKKSTCPECRQVWHGFPKVNVTLRNTVDLLFAQDIEKRTKVMKEDENYQKIIDKFESFGAGHDHESHSSVSWTFVCILVAISIAIAVVVSVGIKKLGGLSEKDLMSKSLEDWSTRDVGVWIRGLGKWAEHYEKNFVEAGIDGGLLQLFSHGELTDPKINMNILIHRKKLLLEIQKLIKKLPKNTFGLWDYKDRKNDMAMFIMLGLREYPRATLTYLYLFNYWDTFLPIFFCTVNVEGNSIREIMKMDQNPSIDQWLEFVPRFLFVPYALVGRFATYFLDINYWTSRVVIIHAVLMTLTELSKSKFLLTGGLREVPYLSMRYFGYVVAGSIFFKFVWPFVPFFITDCIFYWMLYISPLDALNRLLKTLWSYHRGQGILDGHNDGGHGWHFNFEWNTNRT